MKRNLVRIISVIIALLIVSMALPFNALAASMPSLNGTVFLNQSQSVYNHYNTPLYYSFYPDESGLYLISSSGEYDTFVTVFDRDMIMLDSNDDGGENGNFSLSIRLEAHQLYCIKVGAYGQGVFDFVITKPQSAENISVCDIVGNAVTNIYGHTGERIRYFTKFLPDGAIGDNITWSVEDTDIADVDNYGNVTFKNEGSTILWAKAGSISVCVPVVVYGAVELGTGAETSISITENTDHLCINFTAPESADYGFTYSEYEGADVTVWNVSGDRYFEYEDITGGFKIGLNVDQKIIIKVKLTNCNENDFYIKAEKITYADTINVFTQQGDNKFYCDYYNLFVGDTLQLGYDLSPEGSVLRGDVKFFSDDEAVATVDSNGFVNVIGSGMATITVSSYDVSDYVVINGEQKSNLVFGGGYSLALDENNLGTFKGVFSLPEGSSGSCKITYNANTDINLTVLNEYGDFETSKSGKNGILRCWLTDSFSHQLIITTQNFSEPVYFNFTIEEYFPLERLEITDSNGVDVSYLTVNKGDFFTLGYNMYPENADTNVKWVSGDEEKFYIDEHGNVNVLESGRGYIYLCALNDDGEIIDYLSDEVEIYAENIIDSSFGQTHLITISEFTEKLRVRPWYSGFYSVTTYGDGTNINVSIFDVSNNENIDIDLSYISQTTQKHSFYLEANKYYIISFGGNTGTQFSAELATYQVPTEIFITDENNVVRNELNVFTNDYINLDFTYNYYDCYKENAIWTSSDENVATVEGGYVRFLKEGTATITVKTSKTGLTASLVLTVKDGKFITEDSTITETLSYDMGTRFLFTPSVTAVYEVSAIKTDSADYFDLNFVASDTQYNDISLIYGNDSKAAWKFEAGKTYIIKVNDKTMGGTYTFSLSNRSLNLDDSFELTMPETTSSESLYYYFTPEESNYYLFATRGYQDDGWGRGVNIYSEKDVLIAEYNIDGNDSVTYAFLNAGEMYRIEIVRHYSYTATFTFSVSKTVAISSMEIVSMPTDSTVKEGTSDFNFSGLVLSVTTSDGTVSEWSYNQDSAYICGYSYSYSGSDEVDGIVYATLKAGGAQCMIPFTVKAIEQLKTNSTTEITFSEDYDEIQYKFIPEKTGWHSFKSFGHTIYSDERYMNLSGFSWFESVNSPNGCELYAYLYEGENYMFKMYKHYWAAETFKVTVSDNAVGIESIEIKKYPNKMTVYEGMTENYDLTGLVLGVTTSDGVTRDWQYTKNSDRVFEYLYDIRFGEITDTFDLYFFIADKFITLTYEVDPYPLVSIEAITAGDITITENTNGDFISEDTFYYYIPEEMVKIKLNYSDGSYKFASINETVDNCGFGIYDSQTEKPWTVGGDNYFTVVYRDKSVKVPINIVRSTNVVVKMEVLDDGDLTVVDGMAMYQRDEGIEPLWYYDINLSNVKLKLTYDNGDYVITSPNNQVDGMWFDYYQENNPLVYGKDNYLTVNYGELSVDLPVTVLENNIDSIKLNNKPTYVFGDTTCGYFEEDMMGDKVFHLYPAFSHGFEFTVKYKDGTEKTVTPANAEYDYDGGYINISFYDYNGEVTVGKNKAFLAWGGKIIDFDIDVIETDVSSIEVLETPILPEGLLYYPDIAGLKIKINYTDKSSKIITLTEDNIEYIADGCVYYYYVIDGYKLCINYNGDSEYLIRYKGQTVTFNLANVPQFYISDFKITYLDLDNNTVIVNYFYNDNITNTMTEKTVTLDLSVADKSVHQYGYTYNDVLKTDEGIFGYYMSINNDSGSNYYYLRMFECNADGEITELLGDINGDKKVNILDLIRMKKILAGDEPANEATTDFDGDSKTKASDVACLRRSILGSVILSITEGDANGDGWTDYRDALDIASYLAGDKPTFSTRADVNLDGVIDINDMNLINQLIR